MGVPNTATTPLYDVLPAARDRIPWTPLGRFPTRVHRVSGLVPPAVELWVKRDDESGEPYGGNKVRKLEFLLGEAKARGARRLCTIGGIGSHHVLATAIYGQREGFDVEAVVFPQPLTDHVREQLLADLAVGASLHPVRSWLGVPLAWLSSRRRGSAWLSAGGSSPLGSLGYVAAALELMGQIDSGELPRPDVVYVALGSCGTVAGLLHALWCDPPVEVVGVRVVDRVVSNAGAARRLAGEVERLLRPLGGLPRRGLPPRFRVEHGFFGSAYGRSTPEAEQAVARAQAASLRLEPTYTGKTMAALLADARSGRLDGKRVLFWHTYNGVDLARLIARSPGPSALPPLLQRHFKTV